jgi:hypothetical protein
MDFVSCQIRLAVGGFGRWWIGLRTSPSPFFREILENFVTIQKWRIQNGIFRRKPARLVSYEGLILGWCLGWFSRKNVPK